jgi:hypothetical protein
VNEQDRKVPVLNWKLIRWPKGWAFEFSDSSHDYVNPRELQIIQAYDVDRAIREDKQK